MKRVALVLIAGLMLTGCNSTSEPTLPPLASEVPIPVAVIPKSMEGELPRGFYDNPGLGIAPVPREILIDNYELGCTFEFPVYIHNGEGTLVKLIGIRTDPGETIAAIPINAKLANNGLLDIVSLRSSIEETLEAISYDSTTRLLTIRGFLPGSERILEVTYKTVSTYELRYNLPPKGKYHQGYSPMPVIFESFVEVKSGFITLKPMESTIVQVKVTLPPGCRFENKKLEFELLLEEIMVSPSMVQMTKGIAQPVLITLS